MINFSECSQIQSFPMVYNMPILRDTWAILKPLFGLQSHTYQWWRDLFRWRIDLLNFSMGFNIIAPYMVCVTHKRISPSLIYVRGQRYHIAWYSNLFVFAFSGIRDRSLIMINCMTRIITIFYLTLTFDLWPWLTIPTQARSRSTPIPTIKVKGQILVVWHDSNCPGKWWMWQITYLHAYCAAKISSSFLNFIYLLGTFDNWEIQLAVNIQLFFVSSIFSLKPMITGDLGPGAIFSIPHGEIFLYCPH